jgi:hypothetical protein
VSPRDEVKGSSTEQLRRIESVTDSELAHLDAETLLGELLDRVRDVLDADTVAVLLYDEPTGRLVASAARGLEDEVRQGFRIPVGEGFAGRIAAEKRPIILDHVDHLTVRNPVLRSKGIKSLLGVPLLANGQVIGVLHVGTLSSRKFTEADADLLQLVADRVALALLARRSSTERTAAVALQRSLVPGRLPKIPGLEMASRYITAEDGGVGGDWYDLFTVPSGHVCVIVGDVAGRGLKAAVVMGRLRSTVRAYLMETVQPADVLDLADRKLQHFEPTEMATLLLAVVDPSLQTMQVSLAGHPAPVVMLPGAPAEFLDLPIDPPIGVTGPNKRRSTTVDLSPGEVVCFFTDGLVERRTIPLDERLELLRASVEVEHPEYVCQAVMGNLVSTEPTGDDIALLVLRRSD